MNICLISRRFPGINTNYQVGFFWPIARALVHQGHSVTILTSRHRDKSESIEAEGVIAYFLGDDDRGLMSRSFSELAYEKFKELHRERHFDLIHSLDDSGFEIGRHRHELGVAMVYDVDATHIAKVYSILGMSQETLGSLLKTSFQVTRTYLSTYLRHDRKLLKTADAILVHSPQQRTILERYYMYADRRIFMVPFGVEIEDLSPREKSGELMKKLGLPEHAQVVVTVTDMSEFGEMANLLWAFERVAVKKPSARLIVVGVGPLKKEIEFEMLKLALGNRVVFTGEVPPSQLSDYIALADVFVNLSSRSRGIDQSLLEAMAQKKIIIGSEVSPLANVVDDGTDGFLIRPADRFTLSELLLQIFAAPPPEMGEKARSKVLNFFDANKMQEQILAAYSEARRRFVTAHRPFFSLARSSEAQ